MKVKVSEATNPQLNWLVASCVVKSDPFDEHTHLWIHRNNPRLVCILTDNDERHTVFSPTTNWAQGGPIIEQNGLELSVHVIHNGVITSWASEKDWPSTTEKSACGPTPLVAAMRCFVVSHLGNEVEIPEELK